MATATRTSTINDPTTLTATAPSTSYTDPTVELSTSQPNRAHAGLRLLDRISRAILEAGSVPSHPYLAQAVGPNGAVLWTTTSGLPPPGATTRCR